MIKGIQKNVIMLRLTGSPIYEVAYFVLKNGAREPKQGEMVREANRIVSECDPRPARKGSRVLGRWERILLIAYGAIGGAFLTACLWLVSMLVF